jgi:hypothetical protein
MMRKIVLLSILLIFGFCCVSASAATQPVLFFNPDIVESNTGDDDTVLLIMDSAYRGLSGYGLIISIDQPDIAEIIDIQAPVWVGLDDIRRINSSAFLIQGTDIDNMQIPGSVQIALASIDIHAKAPGYANIYATPIAIDDDHKGRYIPSFIAGTIVITGAGPVPIIPMSN